MNMKKMTAVCVLLASGGLPHALADSNGGLPGQNVSSQMATSTLPDEEGEVGGDGEGGEEVDPPAPTVDKAKLQEAIKQAEVFTYQYVKNQVIEAQKVFNDETATQDMVNATVEILNHIVQNAMNLENLFFININEETLKAEYIKFYGQPTGGETEADAFAQSDFGELNQMVKDTINYLLPDYDTNHDEQNTIQIALMHQFQICIARSNNKLVDYSAILKPLMDKINNENSVYYDALKDKQAYITSNNWGYGTVELLIIEYVETGNPSNRLRTLNEDDKGETIPGDGETPGEGEGPQYTIKLEKKGCEVYKIDKDKGCNITTIKENGSILERFIALTDVKNEAKRSSEEALNTLNQYFTTDEQGSDDEWTTVNDLIEDLNTAITSESSTENDIHNAQAKVNESINNLSTLWNTAARHCKTNRTKPNKC